MSVRPDLSVLIVEDEPRYRGFLEDVLRELECVPVSAANAEDATRQAAESPPDLLMLDLNLPGADGLQFLEMFRRDAPDTPAIIITGFGDLKAAKRAIHLGVTDFLSKPCELGQIEQAIGRARRQILARRGLPAPEVDGSSTSQPVRPLAELEREAILAALRETSGNRSEAARALGISRRALYNKLTEYQRAGHEIP